MDYEQAYKDYFQNIEEEVDEAKKPDPSKDYTYSSELNNVKVKSTTDIPIHGVNRMLAESNIDDIDEFAEKLRLVMNAAWGVDWGKFSPEFIAGEDPEVQKLPQITYDVVTRVIPDKFPIKPVQMDTITEVVNGEATGDHFLLYRQWFDYVVEFNVYGSNSLEARRIAKKLETLLTVYIGHLKQMGIGEILFLKEIHPSMSSNAIEGIPTRTLLYAIRVERISIIRASTVRKIELAVKQDSTGESGSLSNLTIKL
jgi:hypothetical protein